MARGTKIRLLHQGKLPAGFISRLSDVYDAIGLEEWQSSLAQPGATDTNIRALVSWARSEVDEKLLRRLPNLEIIAGYGVGYDLIDLGAAEARGIAVSNTPDVLTDDVADLALGLMISVSRQLGANERFLRARRWQKGEMPLLARKFSTKKVGIVGMGRIGQAIARRCQAFEMPVSYYGPRGYDQLPYTFIPDLLELARDSDFLVISCRADEKTKSLIGAEVLTALGPGGVLVNVARGSIIDQQALVEALQANVIAGAGLDVYADEPNIPDALLAMEQVVLLPHIGSTTVETKQAMGDLVLANLEAHFDGRDLPSPVKLPKGGRR